MMTTTDRVVVLVGAGAGGVALRGEARVGGRGGEGEGGVVGGVWGGGEGGVEVVESHIVGAGAGEEVGEEEGDGEDLGEEAHVDDAIPGEVEPLDEPSTEEGSASTARNHDQSHLGKSWIVRGRAGLQDRKMGEVLPAGPPRRWRVCIAAL